MEKFLLIGIPVFLASILLVYKLTINFKKKEISKKEAKMRGSNIYYWEAVVMYSTGITFLILFLLNWANILD